MINTKTKPVTKAQQVEQLMVKYPLLSAISIADRAGCTASYVRMIRNKLAKTTVFDDAKTVNPAFNWNKLVWETPIEDKETPATEAPVHDEVNHPAHYTDGGIETIDYIEAKLTPEEFRGFCIGNALKYMSRAGKKGDATTDLKKAQWYLTRVTKEG